MKSYFLFIFVLFSFLSCKKETTSNHNDWQVISENVRFKSEKGVFNLNSGKFKYSIPNAKIPYKKVILLNASLVGYFTALGLEDKIIGVSSPEYIYSAKIQKKINAGNIENVGNEQKFNIEKIIALKPDAIFTNYVASFGNTYDLIKKNGIEIIFLDEFAEQNPLEKSKYLILFGKLLGKEKESVQEYQQIEMAYDSLKKLAQKINHQPIVLANEMYGNQWFLPGGKTNLARFLADANAAYINRENNDSKAVPMSFEEVFSKSESARFWVNVGNHREKKELLQINPNYAKMNVFNNGQMFNVSAKERGKANDYFESGVVRADLVLKDYIRIFHPQLLPDYNLTYLKPLK